MTNALTPDGAIFLAALCLLLYTLVSARRNHGRAVLPDWLLFGFRAAVLGGWRQPQVQVQQQIGVLSGPFQQLNFGD